jgi:hypothetical protein
MILDAQLQFSADQALTATAASTNVIDLGADRNLGIGAVPLEVLVVVKVASDFTTGDETYTITVQTDDNAAFSSATTVTPAVAIVGAQAAGYQVRIPLPSSTIMERYIRLNYTLGGTTPTVTVDAWLTPTHFVDNQVYYADAMTIA